MVFIIRTLALGSSRSSWEKDFRQEIPMWCYSHRPLVSRVWKRGYVRSCPTFGQVAAVRDAALSHGANTNATP